nr:hypothetical protein [Mycobacterium gordonae]
MVQHRRLQHRPGQLGRRQHRRLQHRQLQQRHRLAGRLSRPHQLRREDGHPRHRYPGEFGCTDLPVRTDRRRTSHHHHLELRHSALDR